jgi:hypothetical protein
LRFGIFLGASGKLKAFFFKKEVKRFSAFAVGCAFGSNLKKQEIRK